MASFESVPSWVASDFFSRKALLDADYTNNLYYWNGVTYATEALLNTAINADKVGIARRIGVDGSGNPNPYIFGSNLLLNGTFDTDITNWATDFALISWGATGALDLNGNNSAGPHAYQRPTVEANKAYAIVGQAWHTTGNGQVGFRTSTLNNLSSFAGTSPLSSASTQGVVLTCAFAAESTQMYIGCYASGSNAGDYFYDNITVKECVPFSGMQSGQVGVKISATAPASTASTVVLWQAGGNERGRIRLELRSDMHLHLIMTWRAGLDSLNPATDIDLGALTPSTPFTVEAQCGVDMASAVLNGGTRLYSTVTQCPGMAQMWIGRSFTGETWTGTIERVSVFSKGHKAASYLMGYGDSLIGYNAWMSTLAAACVPPRRANVHSFAGFGAASVADKFLNTDPVTAQPGYGDPNTIYLFDFGYNDQSNAPTAVPPSIASMVAALPSGSKWLLYNVPNGEAANQYSGGSVYNQFISINSTNLTLYGDGLVVGGHMIKIRENLVASHDGTAQDLIDFGHDIEPISCRQAGDPIHPNTTKGGPLWASSGLAAIQAQGWSPVAPT
ncbi:MAG: hypothetical protein ABJA10_07640 [Aestuariivirga sp.]